MLVLSRRVGQKIVFPTIQAIVQVVALKTGQVRLGIEAPGELPVFRDEILERDGLPLAPTKPPPAPAPADEAVRRLVHQINNRLNSSTIGLALLRRQLELGMVGETAATLARLEQELEGLRQTVEPARPTPAATPAVRRRALIVEDDANECELLAGFLRLAGIDVETAGDGSDALDHLRTHERPDVVLMDMFLPRCDGPSTVRAIRGDPATAGLKIFGMTGADPSQIGLPEGPAGIDRWFRKPLNPAVLLREVNLTART
jgi:carbon storage regulator CsrA